MTADPIKPAAESLTTEALLLVQQIGAADTVKLLLVTAGVIAANTGLEAQDFLDELDALRARVIADNGGTDDAAA